MKKNDNLYGFNKEEFEQIRETTAEQMKKHPDEAERILMEYCHMMLRNNLIDREDVVYYFLKSFGVHEWELFQKYHIKPDAMYLRDKQEDKFIKIKRGGKWNDRNKR